MQNDDKSRQTDIIGHIAGKAGISKRMSNKKVEEKVEVDYCPLKALVIEKDPVNKNWGIVNLTELTEDGVWHNGLNLITSIEDVVKRAEKENVPIITRHYMETKLSNYNT